MNEGRRLFLKSFAALAAAAVTPNVLARLAQDDAARLIAAMRTGVIEDQWFLFNGPVVVSVDNLILRRCVFKFNCPVRMRWAITLNVERFYMANCHIDCGGMGADYAVGRAANVAALDGEHKLRLAKRNKLLKTCSSVTAPRPPPSSSEPQQQP